MATKGKTRPSTGGAAKPTTLTLADVLISLAEENSLSDTRLRDLQSAVKRVAELLGQEPSAVPLDLPAISAKLASVNPIAAGVSAKTLANLRSGFLTAIAAAVESLGVRSCVLDGEAIVVNRDGLSVFDLYPLPPARSRRRSVRFRSRRARRRGPPRKVARTPQAHARRSPSPRP